ncbi:SufE family protein [Paremcibacter congregatus]|uniref:Cysteine desulfuration protein SufE n=1 Tax=Paremcibacter congregatus TaxID=2043170 RepID=A0A2G4YT70_9PROT|nr:SufE family protein [Paremcibacter congregatus]PHZ85528.1 cysteine desulfuration protein SufE [Paremcibacter congregatus]QDE26486.1 SufE family protein [Paremcibacter congregatus]
MSDTIDDVLETFAFIDDWEDRYKYIIDLGRNLPPFDEAAMTEENRVHGCTSRVWLVHDLEDGRVQFRGESDAHIVRGLVALMLMLFSDKTPAEILSINARDTLDQLGLEKHLSPMRTNGLFSMVEKIKTIAAAYQGVIA